MATQGLGKKGPVTVSNSVGLGSVAGGACPLRLVLEKPEGYPGAVDPDRGWVEWGSVGNVVPSNMANSFALASGRKVWVEAVTNGAVPLRVLSASLGAGASVPDDIGGTVSTPPTTAHLLLGEVFGAGTPESPWSLRSTGCGSLWLSARAVGYSCQLATAGDPEADPPVPPAPGGVRTDYELKWDRV